MAESDWTMANNYFSADDDWFYLSDDEKSDHAYSRAYDMGGHRAICETLLDQARLLATSGDRGADLEHSNIHDVKNELIWAKSDSERRTRDKDLRAEICYEIIANAEHYVKTKLMAAFRAACRAQIEGEKNEPGKSGEAEGNDEVVEQRRELGADEADMPLPSNKGASIVIEALMRDVRRYLAAIDPSENTFRRFASRKEVSRYDNHGPSSSAFEEDIVLVTKPCRQTGLREYLDEQKERGDSAQ